MIQDVFTQYLEDHKNESYFLVSAPGNSGDTLLKKGLELYLANNGYIISDDIELADTVMLHGGGNIDDVYYSGIALFKDVSQKYPHKKIVVAPSTCHFSETNFEDVLNGCQNEVHFFTREKKSFSLLSEMKLRDSVSVYLANDTAFLLEDTDYLGAIKRQSSEDYILFSFRVDLESRLLKADKMFFGIRLIEKIEERFFIRSYIKRFIKKHHKEAYKSVNKVIEDASTKDFNTFVDLISHASEVYTDRLHVGILAAMLGKKVHLYCPKQYKVQGVYAQTLHRYSNVITYF